MRILYLLVVKTGIRLISFKNHHHTCLEVGVKRLEKFHDVMSSFSCIQMIHAAVFVPLLLLNTILASRLLILLRHTTQ